MTKLVLRTDTVQLKLNTNVNYDLLHETIMRSYGVFSDWYLNRKKKLRRKK